MPRIAVVSSAILLSLGALAQKKPVTIDAITTERNVTRSAPVQWAPDGKRFAWLEEKDLWLYDVTARREKQLVNLADLDAKAVKSTAAEPFDWRNRHVSKQLFAWSDSGKEILISTSGDLFLLYPDTGKFDQLTSTAAAELDAKLSPDGRLVSFRREHDLYSLEITTGKETRLTHDGSETLLNGELDWVYPEELEIGTAHWWSPDSKRIAYLQFDISHEPVFPQVDALALRARLEPERYPKAGDPNADVRVGIVPATGGETRWMDLGETRDNPAGARGLAARQPGGGRRAAEPRPEPARSVACRCRNRRTRAWLLHEQDPVLDQRQRRSAVSSRTASVSLGQRARWLPSSLPVFASTASGSRNSRDGEWEVTASRAWTNRPAKCISLPPSRARSSGISMRSRFDGKHRRRLTADAGHARHLDESQLRLLPGHRIQPDFAAAAHDASPRRQAGRRVPGSRPTRRWMLRTFCPPRSTR